MFFFFQLSQHLRHTYMSHTKRKELTNCNFAFWMWIFFEWKCIYEWNCKHNYRFWIQCSEGVHSTLLNRVVNFRLVSFFTEIELFGVIASVSNRIEFETLFSRIVFNFVSFLSLIFFVQKLFQYIEAMKILSALWKSLEILWKSFGTKKSTWEMLNTFLKCKIRRVNSWNHISSERQKKWQ